MSACSYFFSDSLNQAKELLQKIPQDDPTYTYSIKYLYYQIYKSEKKYEQALTYLEDYTNILDSTVYSNIQSKILNIEHKYNHLKISKEVDNLKMKQQNYIIVSVICIAALLLIVIGYLLYRKQAQEKVCIGLTSSYLILFAVLRFSLLLVFCIINNL